MTTKANGNDIDVFGVGGDGRLTAKPVVNSEPGTVPFGVSYDAAGNLVVAESGPNALATFSISGSGTVTQLDQVDNGQAATCWVVPAGGYFFVGNAGSGSESRYAAQPAGKVSLLGNTSTDAGTVDASVSAGGKFLYVQTGGAGIVDEYSIGAGGSLSWIGSVTVPGAVGGEGIVAR